MTAKTEKPAMSVHDVDRLVATTRRNPLATVAIAWTSVWVLTMFLGVSIWPGLFAQEGVILLERIGVGLLLAGLVAGAICWLWYRFETARVSRAKADLRALAEAVKGGGQP